MSMYNEFIDVEPGYDKTSNYRPLSNDLVREFIDIYRENPCLWKLSHPDHKNFHYKHLALLKLLDCIKKEEPEADLARVKLKINNIRTSFKREMRKIEKSKTVEGGKVYSPKLWYFGMLWFILDAEVENDQIRMQGRETQSRGDEFNASASSDTNRDGSSRLKERKITISESSKSDRSNTPSPPRRRSPSPNRLDINTRTSRKNCEKSENGLSSNHQSVQQSLRGRSIRNKSYNTTTVENSDDDEFDIIGKVVATKLRKLPERERIIAERLIHDVLCQAQLDRITLDTNVYTRCK